MNDYELTVGLEIHAELKTQSKMFCGCENSADSEAPNIYICPVCMGYPGTLPVINKEAVRLVLLVGTALGGTIADFTEFDRKNYFYPDIPKGYQISQYKYPLVQGGTLNGVELTRIHLEEDTARSLHGSGENFQFPISNFQSNPNESIYNENSSIENSMKIAKLKTENSFIDFNRAGVPLMELVTEPVIHSSDEAGKFAKELQLLFQYLDVSGANMEKGEMRVEVNISVARVPEILTSAEESRIDAELTQNENEGDFLYKDLTYKIRGILFEVRKNLGLGHKEQIYHNALEIEFKKANLSFESKKNISILYQNKKIGVYQPDFVIEDKVIIELKALPEIARPQIEQLWSYLKGCNYKLALLANFGSKDLEIRRIVYDTARTSSPQNIADSTQNNAELIQRPSASSLRESAVPLGTKVEVKNINSFRAVGKAIDFEFKRQKALLEKGEEVTQETRGWDENKEVTFSQRLKESSHDYRYFPEPDLPKLKLSLVPEFSKEELKKSLVELPIEKRNRYIKDFGLKPEDVEIYINDKQAGNFFEEVAQLLLPLGKENIHLASNYIASDIVGLSKRVGGEFITGHITKENFVKIITMIQSGELSSRGAKDILKIVFENGGEPEVVAKEKGLIQKSNEEEIMKIMEEIISNNKESADLYKGGKDSILQFFVGQGMKAMKGSGNPEVIRAIVLELLKQ